MNTQVKIDTTYNGWTNYETWIWKLWLDNDQGSQEYWAERAQDAYNDAVPDFDWETKESRAVYDLAEWLQSEADESAESFMADQSGPFADLLNAAIGRIEWREIAQSLIDDIETN